MVGEDVDAVRFAVAVRGYRMDEVDDVLDRLADESPPVTPASPSSRRVGDASPGVAEPAAPSEVDDVPLHPEEHGA